MDYADLVATYQVIEQTSSRRQMRDALVTLLQRTPAPLLPAVITLTRGALPPTAAISATGMAERLALRAVAGATGATEADVAAHLARSGDLGTTAEALHEGQPGRGLSVEEVFAGLERIAQAGGPGATAQRVTTLADLLRGATPLEARYLVRTAIGTLRLGLGDMTLLDALAAAWDAGVSRSELERAYNLTSDLGLIATRLATGGEAALRDLHPALFHPVRPMLAERVDTAAAVMAHFGGACAAEYKYDGERLQIHKQGDEVRIYSRRLEEISAQYPDVIAMVREQVTAREAVIEGEAIAVDPTSGHPLPFQTLMRRKRKHDVAQVAAELPVTLAAFDVLLVDGEDLTTCGYPERRARLEQIISASPRFHLAERRIVSSVAELQAYFDEVVRAGAEGVLCKSLAANAVYQAGTRGWNWIKLKRDSTAALSDTLDLVVVGAFHGRGQRGGSYGSLLLAAYDPEAEMFRTVTRCGTGFTQKQLAALPEQLAAYRLPHPHPRVDSRMTPDVWFAPVRVLEVTGAELTLSPVHTAAWGALRPDRGLALRAPRFTGRWRDDKAPEDATTTQEILEMYQTRQAAGDKPR
ncbi:MAG: ATP-dependent DNA ligase [Thermomicrobiales bacterium]